jgi:hypothetical protein
MQVEINEQNESERSLLGTIHNCTVVVGFDIPRVGIDCKSIGKNAVLDSTVAQQEKLNGK